jgi:hypothetical protein
MEYDQLNRLEEKSYGVMMCGGIATISCTPRLRLGQVLRKGQASDAYNPSNGQYGRGYRTGMSDTSVSTEWVYDERRRVTKETKNVTCWGTFVTKWG